MSFDVLYVRALRRVRFDASRLPSAARPGLRFVSPKSSASLSRLASGVVSLVAEAPSCPSPSSRLPGLSALTVPQVVANSGSSVQRLHLPYRVLQPPAARSLQPPRARPEGRTGRSPLPKRPVKPCAPRKVPRPLRRQLSESGPHGACEAPPPSAHGLSQTFDGFLLAAPRGLVSCHRHPWGSLPFKAFPFSGSSTVSRRPLPSWRCPSVLPRQRAPKHPPASSSAQPRLQGLAPPEKSVAPAGGLDLPEPGALLGFIPSRVFALPAVATLSRHLLP